MQETYGSQGLRVLAVNAWDEPAGEVAAFARTQALPYPVLLGGRHIFQRKYRGQGVPYNYLIDRRGRIAAVDVLAHPSESRKLAERIAVLLNERPG